MCGLPAALRHLPARSYTLAKNFLDTSAKPSDYEMRESNRTAHTASIAPMHKVLQQQAAKAKQASLAADPPPVAVDPFKHARLPELSWRNAPSPRYGAAAAPFAVSLPPIGDGVAA